MPRKGGVGKRELRGVQFGRLMVMHRVGADKSHNVMWECVCDCGEIATVRACSLGRQTRSCGCLYRETRGLIRLAPKQPSVNRLFWRYQNNAKVKDREFALTREDVGRMVFERCWYCGCNPSRLLTDPDIKEHVYYNGIDRIDTAVGYCVGNVRTCCARCNYAKHIMSENQFVLWLRRASEYIRQEHPQLWAMTRTTEGSASL